MLYPEPLMQRALTIAEASYGPDHPNVATSLNNLAQLLQDTKRLAEAEPLYRRALAIDEPRGFSCRRFRASNRHHPGRQLLLAGIAPQA